MYEQDGEQAFQSLLDQAMEEEQRRYDEQARAQQQANLVGQGSSIAGTYGGKAAIDAISNAAPSYTPSASATETALGIGAAADKGVPVGTALDGSIMYSPSAATAVQPWYMSAMPYAAGLGVAAAFGPSAYKAVKGLTDNTGRNDADAGIKGALLTNPVTAWAVPVADALGLKIKSGKHKDQYARDSYRKGLQEGGFLDDNYRLDLGNGQYFDYGDERLRGLSGDPTQRGADIVGRVPNNRAYNIDWNAVTPDDSEAITLADAFANAMGVSDPKRRSDFVGQTLNAGKLAGDNRAAIKALYGKAGEQAGRNPRDVVYEGVANAWRNGKISAQERDAQFAAIDKQYGVVNKSGGRWEQGAGLSEEESARNSQELSKPKTSATAAPRPAPRGSPPPRVMPKQSATSVSPNAVNNKRNVPATVKKPAAGSYKRKVTK